MSKLKLFLVLILVGAIVFIVSHLSLLRNYGHTLQVVNSVHLYSNNGRHESLNNNKKTKAKMKIVKSFRVHDNDEEETVVNNITVKLIDRDVPKKNKLEQNSVRLPVDKDKDKNVVKSKNSDSIGQKSAISEISVTERKLQEKLLTTALPVNLDEIKKEEKVAAENKPPTSEAPPPAKSDNVEAGKGNAVVEESNSIPEGKSDEQKEEQSKEESVEEKEPEVVETGQSTIKLPMCAPKGINLVGPLYIDQSVPKDLKSVEKQLSIDFGGPVEKGGWWQPDSCQPRVKVAIIIPFRNRFEQLKVFLRHMHPILQRQQLFYRIIVVEQMDNDPFNRAGLFNVGYAEAIKMADFDCLVFSDVDLLPENDRNYYGCPTSPRHMSVAVDKFNYQLPYEGIFGGVGAFKRDHFEDVNGFSNLFWGWGGEDDDLFQRIRAKGYQLTRPSLRIGRYTMVKINHFQSSKADPNRMNLLQNSKERMYADGLNTLKYVLKGIREDPLVTFVQIKIAKSMYGM